MITPTPVRGVSRPNLGRDDQDRDAAQGKFTNSPEANRQLHHDYQNGWSLEAV